MIDLSIVIPTFGRPQRLRECLDAIKEVRAADISFEVIVVDDGGPVSLAGIVADFDGHFSVRLVEKVRGGPGSARNAGARIARGRLDVEF